MQICLHQPHLDERTCGSRDCAAGRRLLYVVVFCVVLCCLRLIRVAIVTIVIT